MLVVSGCFSGGFLTQAIATENRIVLTASRADRTSFGCSVKDRVNVFDGCVLAHWDDAPTWQVLAGLLRGCVERAERSRGFSPASEPQAFFGRAMRDLPTRLTP